MQAHGYTLLFHPCILEQLNSLHAAVLKIEAEDPDNAASHASVKLFRAISKLVLDAIPQDPGGPQFRQGKTLGQEYTHWRRAKFGGRFRLFFRYDSASKIIVFAWVNDENTLRKAGSTTDPYTVFSKMLDSGNPPDSWGALVAASQSRSPLAP